MKKLFILLLIISACKVTKNKNAANNIQQVTLDEVKIKAPPANKPAYQATETRTVDMIHMSLKVNFDYQKQEVNSEFWGSFTAYSKPVSNIVLDAKKIIIHDVNTFRFIKNELQLLDSVRFTYDSSQITITLDKPLTFKDTIAIAIYYIAQPNKIKQSGSEAITDAKGLYFINPTKTIPNKPRQIWTQGETQSNSCWFPCIDIPNEKYTQEISITVDSADVTLSNGELMMSKYHKDGTRTDYWQQTKPHAPYLTMLAVGNWAVIKDYWRDSVEVNYYVEPDYAPYAKLVFGNTPEMMEFFSKKFGYDFPWDKYSQIVVRDFVSGAMENTSAVVHFEGLQHDSREHLDNTHEDIISHELAHHWFGDLVTCESWSNIALNESFATYGSYLWDEYKYGRAYADYSLAQNLSAYLRSGNKHKEPLARYYYHNREDVFDVVSYQKGSCILHLLRYTLGDDVFFAGIKNYLHKHAFGTVEIHDFRLAMEEASGQDLNWFFNQWFFRGGHPVLWVNYSYSEDRKRATLVVKQTQDSNNIFILPVSVDVYTNKGVERQNITIDKRSNEFTFTSNDSILLVNFDAEKVIVGKVFDNKSYQENILLFEKTHSVIDKLNVLNKVLYGEQYYELPSDLLHKIINLALNDSFYAVRQYALSFYPELLDKDKKIFTDKIIQLAFNDENSKVRTQAIEALDEDENKMHKTVFEKALNDSSYIVVYAALNALESIDTAIALANAKTLIHSNNKQVQITCGRILSEYGSQEELNLIKNTWLQSYKATDELLISYFALLTKQPLATRNASLSEITALKNEANARQDTAMFNYAFQNFLQYHETNLLELKERKAKLKKNNPDLPDMEKRIEAWEAFVTELKKL